MVTIFCVKFLLLAVISKNFNFPPSLHGTFVISRFMVCLLEKMQLRINHYYKVLHQSSTALWEAVDYCYKALNLRCFVGLCYLYEAPDMHV